MCKDDRLSVLLVGQAAPARGGIPSFLNSLAADLDLAAHADVRLLNTTRQAERRAGTLTGGNLVHAVQDAVRTYREARRVDVVHVQTALLPVLPLLRALAVCAAGRVAGAAVICHVHHARLSTSVAEARAAARSSRPLLRLLRLVTTRVLAVSAPGGEALRELVPGLDVGVVDNAVDVAAALPARPVEEPAVLLYVGTLTRRKGVLDLVAALNLLAEQGCVPVVQVAGGSNEVGEAEADELRQALRACRLPVELLGSLDSRQVAERLAGASIFVLASHWEGQPIAILEAMAAGLPVVSTTVGATPDVVRDGIDGLLVPPHDPERLAGALLALVRDPAARGRMGTSSRERARERFDRPVLRKALLTEYARAAGRLRGLEHTNG